MKFASYRRADGQTSFGVVAEGRVFDLRAALASDSLDTALAEGSLAAFVRRANTRGLPECALDKVQLLTPLLRPGKLICIGRNYADHAAEVQSPPPAHPSVFLRLPQSLVPPGAPLVRPAVSTAFDFEGELAVVLGTGGRDIAPPDALQHVFGYSCFNDGSVRDFQFEHSLAAGKNFDNSGSFGSWLVSADEVGDPRDLVLETRVSGREMQHGRVSGLLFDIPFLIAYLSRVMRLAPGDVIATGTPAGVGFSRKPPVWLRPGDVVEVTISRIGTLRNPVVEQGAG